jgi:hypothetical protein
MFAETIGIARSPPRLDPHITAFTPAQLLKRLQKSCITGLATQIVLADANEHTDPPRLLGLLRARSERPCD